MWVNVRQVGSPQRGCAVIRRARLAVMLNDARGWAKATLPTYQDRKEFFEGIVNGDPDPVQLVREGRESEVLALIEAAKESHAAAAADG